MNNISMLNSSDLNDAYDIEQKCHEFPWSKPIFLSNQGERYHNKKYVINTNLAGFLICQLVSDEATVFNIAVHPDYQRKGVATALLTNLMTDLQKKNISTIWLEVRISNYHAIDLYQKLGFNQITIRPNYYQTKKGTEDALIMAYMLL